MGNEKKKPVAVGRVYNSKKGYGTYFRDTSIRFDMETFEEIRQRAIKKKTSFGAEIRMLVELGLETEKMGNMGFAQ